MKKQIIILLIISLLFTSCSIFKKTPTISEKKQTELFKYYFAEAQTEIILEDYGEAIVLLTKCLEIKPESAATFYLISEVYFNKDDYYQSIHFCEKSVQLEPENYWYKYFLGRLYIKTYQISKAIPLYEDVILQSKNTYHYYELAYYYEYEEQYNSAIYTYTRLQNYEGINRRNAEAKLKVYTFIDDQKAIETELLSLINVYPSSIKYYSKLATHYLNNEDFASALSINKKMLKLFPTDAKTHLSFALFHKARNNYKDVYSHLKIAFNDDFLENEEKLDFITDDTLFFSTENYQNNQLDTLYNILIEKNPEYTETYYHYSKYLISTQQTTKAINNLKIILETDMINYEALNLLSNLYFHTFNYVQLDTIAQYSLELYPNQPRFYLYAGVAALGLYDYSNAENNLKYGLDIIYENNQLSATFNFYLSRLYAHMEDNYRQKKFYDQALILAENNYSLLNTFAYFYAFTNNELDTARNLNEICLENNPNNSTYLFTKALILYKKSDYEQANEIIKQTIQNSETLDYLYYDLSGDILLKLGKNKLAIKEWEKALDIDKTNPVLQQKILINHN